MMIRVTKCKANKCPLHLVVIDTSVQIKRLACTHPKGPILNPSDLNHNKNNLPKDCPLRASSLIVIATPSIEAT